MSEIAKVQSGWYSPRVDRAVNVVRWGHAGQPVLLFPTAGGDAEECERFLMIKVLAPLLTAGRIRVYSCDSVSGRTWTDGESSGLHRARTQIAFDSFVRQEVIPAIWQDSGGKELVICAGASIGAFNAASMLCRNPDLFKLAICMSGTYKLERWMNGQHSFDFHVVSPIHFIPGLPDDATQLHLLRQRMLILATGSGRWEAPWESWELARTLGTRGIPNRVDDWGPDHDHNWVTWRAMLPKYLDDMVP
jgi:esterase/lipase superfamily enzyme